MTAPMTLDQWMTLSKASRLAVWSGWTIEQRREMADLFIAQTPKWHLRYPDDYNQPADSPVAIGMLATDVDNALTTLSTRALPHRGWTRSTDTPLTADALRNVAFDAVVPSPPGTSHAWESSDGFTMIASVTGMFAFSFACDVQHQTTGTEKTFQLVVNRTAGSVTGPMSAAMNAKQVTPGWSSRIEIRVIAYVVAGDKYICQIRPVGASATGWSLTWASHQLTQVR